MDSVLVIEKDAGLREAFTAVLQSEHYQVRAIADVLGALPLLAQESFGLVLADCFGPRFGLDGFSEVALINRAAPTTPVVVATSHPQVAAFDASHYGVAEILVKPLDIWDLLACVRKTLSDNQARLRAFEATWISAGAPLRSARMQPLAGPALV